MLFFLMEQEWKEGIDFIKIGPPTLVNGRCIYKARCCHCKAEFTNHRSIYKHKSVCKPCDATPRQLNLDSYLCHPAEKLEDIHKLLIDVIISLNFPLNCIENKEFRALLGLINPELATINRHQLRRMIMNYSNQIQQKALFEFKNKMT